MTHSHEPCIGILGGGQLGRMLAIEAKRLGYQTLQWTGGECSGAERASDHTLTLPFDDPSALASFLQQVQVVTCEFENIPADLVAHIEQHKPTFPPSRAIQICQDRQREKEFLQAHNLPSVRFRIIENRDELNQALRVFPGNTILKTAQFGYDGKGQAEIPHNISPDALDALWAQFQGVRCILEEKIELVAELSVMVVRAQNGEVITYDPTENEHQNHILHLSISPARLPQQQLQTAQEIASKIATQLDYVGVLGVEFFLDTQGRLLVNEMAPRPHNSGHHTIDACQTSQFEQQLRAVVNLPLGSPALLSPVVMWNLLGDLWTSQNESPDWSHLLKYSGSHLHLYGKKSAKPKRKMGHATFLAPSTEQALENAHQCIAHYQA